MRNIYFLLFSQLLFSQLQLNSFYPTSGASGGGFGTSMAMYENEIVTSTYSINMTLTQIGKVYVFNKTSNAIIQSQILIENDVLQNDGYGNSVGIENEIIAIGAPKQGLNNSNTGSVYIYKKVGGSYQFHQKILSITSAQDDGFGNRVKIFNNRLYVASKNNFYVFDLINDDWSLSQSITLPNANSLGFSNILISNNQLLITSLAAGTTSGVLYNTFALNNNQWIFQNTQDFNSPIGVYLYDAKIYVIQPQIFKINIFEFSNNLWALNSSFNYTQTDQIFNRIVVNDSNIFLGSNGYILQLARKFPVTHFRKIENNWIEQPPLYGHETSSTYDDYFGSNLILEGNNLIIAAAREFSFVPATTGRSYYTDTTLGIDENFLSSLYFYPNPTKDYLNLYNEHLDEINSISIFQIDGKIVSNSITNFEKIDLRNFNIGVYFMKIQFKNNIIITKKIVKN